MRSIGTRLLLTVSVPVVLLATVGTIAAWRMTDHAVREKTSSDALGLAAFIATSFGAVEETPPGTAPRVAHRAVTNAVRSNWSGLQLVSDLRIIGRDGRVKWSRAIEEEDRPWSDAASLLAVPEGRATFEAPPRLLPMGAGGGGEVVYPLGGVACGGCHTGEATMRAGVLVLTVSEPALRTEVARVFTNATWFIALFVLTIAATIFVAVRRYVSQPIARLASVMKRAEEGDVVVRAPDLGEDELGRLAVAFNRMLGRLTDLKVVEIDAHRELELKAEVERRATELQLLFELSRTIASTLDLEEVLHRVTSEVPRKLGVHKFSVMLLNAAGQLEVQTAHPAGVGSEGMTFDLGEGVCGHVARHRARYYAPDLANESLFLVKAGKEHGSLLSVPMVRGEELLGVLNFERAALDAFPASDQDFFVAVADQIALAVQNARLHETTVELSVTDPLTQVPNRRYLYQQLEAELARATRYATPLSMVMIDIDHFKLLNDTAGHSAGDDVLRKVAQLMKHSLRKVDTLARYGGEEFIVLLPQLGREEAAEVAEKLRRAIAESGMEQGRTQPLGKVTISVGVATMPNDATNDVKLIDSADAALYASKRGGRNKVTSYTSGMELEPTRQRGRLARARTGETPILVRKEE